MFEGFKLSMVDAGDATLRVRHGGDGQPVFLLHGHPQTHVMWHKIAPLLARDYQIAVMRHFGFENFLSWVTIVTDAVPIGWLLTILRE